MEIDVLQDLIALGNDVLSRPDRIAVDILKCLQDKFDISEEEFTALHPEFILNTCKLLVISHPFGTVKLRAFNAELEFDVYLIGADGTDFSFVPKQILRVDKEHLATWLAQAKIDFDKSKI